MKHHQIAISPLVAAVDGLRPGQCPLCGAKDRFGRFRFGLLRCSECSLVVQPNIWLPCINETMEDAWFGHNWNPASSVWVQWFEALSNRRTYRRLRPVRGQGDMLEVGFGSGSFLAYMRARGWAVAGCDASEAVCERARRQFDIVAHCGAVGSLPDGPQFDLVVMNHVLEHVQQPLEMLADIRLRMKPGAWLHIAVPNVDCWEARLPGWIGYQPYHLSYFSRATLGDAVEAAGLEIESVTTHEQSNGWFLALLGTALPFFRGEARQEIRTALHTRRRTSPWEHAYRFAIMATGAVTWPLRRLQERCGRGDEVIVMARKAG